MHVEYGNAAIAGVKRSDLESVQHEIECLTQRARDIVGMAENIADRLYGGNAAPPTQPAGPTPVPSGAVGEVNSRLASLRSALDAADNQMSRLSGLV